jgi:hypothetical protein
MVSPFSTISSTNATLDGAAGPGHSKALVLAFIAAVEGGEDEEPPQPTKLSATSPAAGRAMARRTVT